MFWGKLFDPDLNKDVVPQMYILDFLFRFNKFKDVNVSRGELGKVITPPPDDRFLIV
jgi:hypothetical protein